MSKRIAAVASLSLQQRGEATVQSSQTSRHPSESISHALVIEIVCPHWSLARVRARTTCFAAQEDRCTGAIATMAMLHPDSVGSVGAHSTTCLRNEAV